MELFPAIDLKGGRCVRLTQGRMDSATAFNEDPAAQARAFQDAGFSWLHIVDLDGAIEGRARNEAAARAILDAVSIPAQIGGGVRTLDDAQRWIEAGAARVIMGTAALTQPDLVRAAARQWPGRIAVAIDARDGRVAAHGWVSISDVAAEDLAQRFEDAGVAALIVTDITRDGLKGGINVPLTGAVADAVSIPVIASGGLKSVDDIRALKARPGRAIAGAILGRALYDGDIDPAEALAAA